MASKVQRGRVTSGELNFGTSSIRTNMAMVRLRRRKWAERDEKRTRSGANEGSWWFGQFARNDRILQDADR